MSDRKVDFHLVVITIGVSLIPILIGIFDDILRFLVVV